MFGNVKISSLKFLKYSKPKDNLLFKVFKSIPIFDEVCVSQVTLGFGTFVSKAVVTTSPKLVAENP